MLQGIPLAEQTAIATFADNASKGRNRKAIKSLRKGKTKLMHKQNVGTLYLTKVNQ